jgi:hypothetical protein
LRYRALKGLKANTPQGEKEIQPGEIIFIQSSVPYETILRLMNEGRIVPVGRIAYKVYSEILGANLWVIADERDMEALRASQGITESIYTSQEIKKLKGVPKDALKNLHKAKKVFSEAIIEDVKFKPRENN